MPFDNVERNFCKGIVKSKIWNYENIRLTFKSKQKIGLILFEQTNAWDICFLWMCYHYEITV